MDAQATGKRQRPQDDDATLAKAGAQPSRQGARPRYESSSDEEEDDAPRAQTVRTQGAHPPAPPLSAIAASAQQLHDVGRGQTGLTGRLSSAGVSTVASGAEHAQPPSASFEARAPPPVRWADAEEGGGTGEDDAPSFTSRDTGVGHSASGASPSHDLAVRGSSGEGLPPRPFYGSPALYAQYDAGRVDAASHTGGGASCLRHPLLRGCRSLALFKPIHAIDEGAYGKVWLGEERATSRKVALKQIKFDKIHPNEGFPVTALREINTLLSLSAPGIVRVEEVVVGSTLDKIFLVMEFLPHNLREYVELLPPGSFFTQGEVKCLLSQLLAGVATMHAKWLLHRDLKTANVLMDNAGRLVICDFGLARRYGEPVRAYTDTVVTLWYRAPEVLLGCRDYGPPLDVWSVGCIFAELLTKEPLFMPKNEGGAVTDIFRLLGTPRDTAPVAAGGVGPAPPAPPGHLPPPPSWPGWKSLPLVASLRAHERTYPPQHLRKALKLGATAYAGSAHISDAGLHLLSSLLTLDPASRITAGEALAHPWFTEAPLPTDPRLMPAFPSAHDGATGGRRGEGRAH